MTSTMFSMFDNHNLDINMAARTPLKIPMRSVLIIQRPILPFLLPSVQQIPARPQRRHATTTSAPSSSTIPSSPDVPLPNFSQSQRNYLDSALRVNQAGELAATLIYTHQTPPILRSHPHLRTLMQHMYAQEAGHFSTFNRMLAEKRVRPTLLYPVWTAAASTLGWVTGMMGREAAMACTEAVETEIGEHYNSQVRELILWMKEMEHRGEEIGHEMRELVETLKRIRDEELEHLNEAVGEGAKEAKPYELLNRVIRSGCKGAIWISERV